MPRSKYRQLQLDRDLADARRAQKEYEDAEEALNQRADAAPAVPQYTGAPPTLADYLCGNAEPPRALDTGHWSAETGHVWKSEAIEKIQADRRAAAEKTASRGTRAWLPGQESE